MNLIRRGGDDDAVVAILKIFFICESQFPVSRKQVSNPGVFQTVEPVVQLEKIRARAKLCENRRKPPVKSGKILQTTLSDPPSRPKRCAIELSHSHRQTRNQTLKPPAKLPPGKCQDSSSRRLFVVWQREGLTGTRGGFCSAVATPQKPAG